MTDSSGSCKEVSEILSLAMDRELTEQEKKRLQRHFADCTWCHDHNGQLEVVRKAGKCLGEICSDADADACLPESARTRIKKALKEICPPPR